MQSYQRQGAVRGEAETAGQELYPILERVSTELDTLQSPQDVKEYNRHQHLTRHSKKKGFSRMFMINWDLHEEGKVEVVAGHHSFVEEVHGDAATEVKQGNNEGFSISSQQSLEHS